MICHERELSVAYCFHISFDKIRDELKVQSKYKVRIPIFLLIQKEPNICISGISTATVHDSFLPVNDC